VRAVVLVGKLSLNGAKLASKPAPLFKDFADIWHGEKEIEWRTSHKQTVPADLAKAQVRGKKQTLSNARINKIVNPLRQILCEAADRYPISIFNLSSRRSRR
jgi:integrase